MQKIFILIMLALTMYAANAQTPEKFSYQAVIRNSANSLLTNTNVGIQVSILQGSATGTAVYVERHTATTNSNGLLTVSIGAGTPVTGVFDNINWSTGPYYIKTETDPAGGINYSITGTSQLMSVPYALYAKNVQNNDDADASPDNEIQSLSINGNELTISQGNTVTLPAGGTGGDNWGTQVAMTDATLTGSGLGSSPLKIAQQGANSGQVLKWNGTNWLPADDQGSSGSSPTGPAGGDLGGTYPNPVIAANTITSSKITDGTVATTDIADGAINTPKLTDGSVNSAKIADGAVSTSKIADISITAPKLADASVTSDKIYDGTIVANDIAMNAVTEIKIIDNAVTSGKIADGAVNTAEIANNAVTVTKLPAGATPTTYLRGDGTWATPSGGGGTPGGNEGNIQFNNNGSFSGENEFFWNSSTNRLGIGTSTPSAYLEILHNDYAKGLIIKSAQNSSTVLIDAKNGNAKLEFAKDGEGMWFLCNSFSDDSFAIYEWTSATTAIPRMRIIRNTGKAVFWETVEVRNGKGIIRSIDNVQRKTLSTTVTVNTTIAAGATTNITFTFPESFSAVPVAYIGNASGGGFAEVVMSVATVTATGGKLFIYNPKSSAQNPNFTVNIVAVGQE